MSKTSRLPWALVLSLIGAPGCDDKKDESESPEAAATEGAATETPADANKEPEPAEAGGTGKAEPEHDPASTEAEDATARDAHAEAELEHDEPDRTPGEVKDARERLRDDMRKVAAAARERGLELDKRKVGIESAQRELEARLERIGDLEKRLEIQLGIGKAARQRREERVAALATLISTMSPQAAAEIVAQMSDADAQMMLLSVARKNDRKAAKLLALMPPDRAAQLGQLYIDRDPDSPLTDLPPGSVPGLQRQEPGAPAPAAPKPPAAAAAQGPAPAPPNTAAKDAQ